MKLQLPSAKDRQTVLQQWLQQAARHHQQRQLDEAEAYYQAILKSNPGHIDAKHLLGLLKFQQGRHLESVRLIRQVLVANKALPTAHTNLANSLKALGKYDEALASYDAAISLKPDYIEALNNRGLLQLDLKRPEAALTDFSRALAVKPDYTEALFNQGLAFDALQRPEDALGSYDRLLRLHPQHAEALNNRGSVLRGLKQTDAALECFEAALNARPDHLQALNNRGNVLLDMKREADALASFEQALAINPDYPEALNNHAVALNALTRHREALVSVDRALAIRPDYVEAHFVRGVTLNALERFEEALVSLDRALALEPNHAGAWFVRGLAFNGLMRFSDALADIDRSLAIEPDAVEPRFNRGLIALLTGDFVTGWIGYSARFDRDEAATRRLDAPIPAWRGEPIAGKRLIIYEEQGIGDTLMVARYLPMLVAAGADVTLLVRQGLHRILQPIAKSIRLVPEVQLPVDPPFDYQCALMSLPQVFGTTVATIPADVPYLMPEPERVAIWRDKIGPKGRKIGIIWQGNPSGKVDVGRSYPLHQLLPIAACDDVRLISLQKNHGLDQLVDLPAAMRVETLGDAFDGGADAFVDTAAVIASLDLVITSDTSIAHLAGGLGRPVWLALKQVPDWRWLLERTDSPWYPTMRLYRQTRRGDWAGVFEAMARDLV